MATNKFITYFKEFRESSSSIVDLYNNNKNTIIDYDIDRIKFLGCRDPRWKHEYLDSGQSWLMTDEEEEEEEEVDESDKHI